MENRIIQSKRFQIHLSLWPWCGQETMATAVMVLAKVWNNPDDGVDFVAQGTCAVSKVILNVSTPGSTFQKNIVLVLMYRIVKDHVET